MLIMLIMLIPQNNSSLVNKYFIKKRIFPSFSLHIKPEENTEEHFIAFFFLKSQIQISNKKKLQNTDMF